MGRRMKNSRLLNGTSQSTADMSLTDEGYYSAEDQNGSLSESIGVQSCRPDRVADIHVKKERMAAVGSDGAHLENVTQQEINGQSFFTSGSGGPKRKR